MSATATTATKTKRGSSSPSSSSKSWSRRRGGRLRWRRTRQEGGVSAVQLVWTHAPLVETLMASCAVTLDARDLAHMSCVCKDAYRASWPWPCPFLRCSVPEKAVLDDVPLPALARLVRHSDRRALTLCVGCGARASAKDVEAARVERMPRLGRARGTPRAFVSFGARHISCCALLDDESKGHRTDGAFII